MMGAMGPYPSAEESKIPNTSSRMEGRYFRAAPCKEMRDLPALSLLCYMPRTDRRTDAVWAGR